MRRRAPALPARTVLALVTAVAVGGIAAPPIAQAGGWSRPRVLDERFHMDYEGWDMVVDEAGAHHVVREDPAGTPEYATDAGGSWRFERYPVAFADQPRLAVHDGHVWVAYIDPGIDSQPGVWVAHRSPDGTWDRERVVPGGRMSFPAIAVDDRAVHLVYRERSSGLHYLRDDGAGFVGRFTDVLCCRGGGPVIALASSGLARIAYASRVEVTDPAYRRVGGVQVLSERAGGDWSRRPADHDPIGPLDAFERARASGPVDIAIDGGDRVHVTFAKASRGTAYARQVEGGYRWSEVGGQGGGTLALRDGRAVVAYPRGTGIALATRAGTGWSREQVTLPTRFVDVSPVVAAGPSDGIAILFSRFRESWQRLLFMRRD